MPEESDPLQSLIADIIEAESRGDAVDRVAFLRQYPEHADSLREFFANHDSMKAGSSLKDVMAPPAGPGSVEDATLPPRQAPHEEATLPPSKLASEDAATLAGRDSESVDEPTVGDKLRYFGDYELLEEIARGGMGVVYKARQVNLNRIVALKMILAGQLAGEEDVKRFYTEAEAAANLDHPGIVPIFEVGQHQGQHYFSMGYIEGQSLAQKVAAGPLPPREAAELVTKICEAMAYAHERGVIHRDLKPANILLDQNGQPKVTDFGLAKQMNVDSGLTGTGQILGTPSYMAPEQASGKADEVGPLADVYALGAILYCLLTGRPPFQAANPMDTLLQVLDREPIALRQLDAALPIDIETICLKCLSKPPEKRYSTAMELAEELVRFLSDRPILARPVTRVERAWRWCKRNPVVAASTTFAAMFLVIGTIVSTYFALIARQETANARASQEIAELNEAEARTQSERANQEKAEALRQEHKAESRLYASQIASALREWETNNAGFAMNLLSATNAEFRGWEYAHLSTLFNSGYRQLAGGAWPQSIAVSPDGSMIATGHMLLRGTKDMKGLETLHLRNAIDGTVIFAVFAHNANVNDLAFHPNSSVLATAGSDMLIKLWNTSNGNTIKEIQGHKASIRSIAFDPNGKFLVSGDMDGIVKVWDSQTLEALQTFSAHTAGVYTVAVSPNGKYVASAAADGQIKVWDVSSSQCIHSLKAHTEQVSTVTFYSDEMLLSGSTDGTLKRWDVATGNREATLYAYGDAILDVTIDQPNARAICACFDGTLCVWNLETELPESILRGHKSQATCVAVDSRSRLLLSGGVDGSLLQWNYPARAQPMTYSGHEGNLTSNALLNSTESEVVAGTHLGKIVCWDVTSGAETRRIDAHSSAVTCLAINSDKTLIASSGLDKKIRLWNFASGELVREFSDNQFASDCVAFSPSAPYLAAGVGVQINIWNFNSGELVASIDAHDYKVQELRFTPKGEQLLSTSISGKRGPQMWDVGTWSLTRSFGKKTSSILELSPDGRKLLTSNGGSKLRIWDLDKGQILTEIVDETNTIYMKSAAWSNDGSRIATGQTDNSVKIWDAIDGSQVLTMEAPGISLGFIGFSQTGDMLALSPSMLILWDATQKVSGRLDAPIASGVAVKPPEAVTGSAVRPTYAKQLEALAAEQLNPRIKLLIKTGYSGVGDVAFSPSGKHLATVGYDVYDVGKVKLLDASTGKEIFDFKGHAGFVSGVAFSPDGTRLASSGRDGTVKVWDTSSGELILNLEGSRNGENDVAFSPNGDFIASAGFENRVTIWDALSGAEVRKLNGHTHSVGSVSFSKNGKRLTSTSIDESVRVWNVSNGEEELVLRGHAGGAYDAVFSLDGSRLASVGGGVRSGELKLWDAVSGEELGTFGGHPARILSVSYSPDGRALASGGNDAAIRLWDTSNGRQTLTLSGHSRGVTSVAFSPDGTMLASASSDLTVIVWDVASNSQNSN